MGYNGGSEVPAHTSFEVVDVTAKWIPPDLDDLIKRYSSGQSVNSLAAHYGTSRHSVTQYVRGLPHYRGTTEANRITAANKSPEDHRRYAQAANAAVRGVPKTFEAKSRAARARQGNGLRINDTERTLATWLTERGVPAVPQQAIGPYNCDIGADPIAIEIQGGHWHASGAHRARFPNRTRYILDQGWLLVFVWVTNYAPLRPALADYLVTLFEQAHRDPALNGQYRVVWGTGQDCTRPGLNLNQLALVPPRDRGDRLGA